MKSSKELTCIEKIGLTELIILLISWFIAFSVCNLDTTVFFMIFFDTIIFGNGLFIVVIIGRYMLIKFK